MVVLVTVHHARYRGGFIFGICASAKIISVGTQPSKGSDVFKLNLKHLKLVYFLSPLHQSCQGDGRNIASPPGNIFE
jgi:hypothetical protein